MKLLFFTLLLYLVRSTCNVTVQEDVIFLLDYSGSVMADNWQLELDFAEKMVLEYLPDDSRVACVGFGTSTTVFFNYETYDTKQEIANGIQNDAQYLEGKTNLQGALGILLDQIIEIDVTRTTLLIIITDGSPTDYPCLEGPALLEAGVKTVILGFGVYFIKDYVTCLASDEDILEIEDFSNFDDFAEQTGSYICSADYEWKLTEVKPAGSNQFLEFYNFGGTVDSQDVRVYSNLFADVVENDYYDFPVATIPTGARIILSASEVAGCDNTEASLCYRFAVEFDSGNTDISNWQVRLTQVFNTGSAETITDIEVLNATAMNDLITIPITYSYELKSDLFDNTFGSNWRKSCDVGGSPGAQNIADCPDVCQTDDDCLGSPNTCESTGCDCNVNFLEHIATCEVIPEIPSCTVTGFVANVDECASSPVEVNWEVAQASFITGYKLDYVSGGTAISTELFESITSLELYLDHCEWDTISIASIGEIDAVELSDGTYSYGATRFSIAKSCTVIKTTNSPTTAPTTNPTGEPTTAPTTEPTTVPSFVPTVVPTQVPSNVPSCVPTETPSMHPSSSAPTADPTISMPTNAPSLVPSIHPTISEPTYIPSTTPSIAPSLQPVWLQPVVTLSGLDWYQLPDDSSYYFSPKEFKSDEDVTMRIRIYLSPDHEQITVFFGLVAVTGFNSTNRTEALVVNSSYTFVESANIKGVDITEIDLRSLYTFEITELQNVLYYEFQIFESLETDRFGRLTYTRDDPHVAEIIFSYAEPFVVEEGGEDRLLPIWAYFAIAVGVILLILISGFFYYKWSRSAKKVKKTLEDNKALEKDLYYAEEGFMADVAEQNIHVNPLADGVQKDTAMSLEPTTMGMITTNDDEEEFAPVRSQFGPVPSTAGRAHDNIRSRMSVEQDNTTYSEPYNEPYRARRSSRESAFSNVTYEPENDEQYDDEDFDQIPNAPGFTAPGFNDVEMIERRRPENNYNNSRASATSEYLENEWANSAE